MIEAIVIAHLWYDPYCCNQRDCKPINYIPETSQKYVWLKGVPYPRKKVRDGKDFLWHVCRRNDGTLRCVYRPAKGV